MMGIAVFAVLVLLGFAFCPISRLEAQNGTISTEQTPAVQAPAPAAAQNAPSQPLQRRFFNWGPGRWGGNLRGTRPSSAPQSAPAAAQNPSAVPYNVPAASISTEDRSESPVLIAAGTAPKTVAADEPQTADPKGTEAQKDSEEKDLQKNAFPGSFAQWDNAFHYSWVEEEKERHQIKPHADNKAVVKITKSQKDGHTYGNYTEADLLLWQEETERLVVEGSLIFHNADLLGSTNATSCDMCHPDAEGTHAETYPKYQVQLGRVALLRDMANWCLKNPCRAEPMSGDDPRMRALEAYMQAQRTGKIMKYGKH